MRESGRTSLAERHRARAEAVVAARNPRLHGVFIRIFRRTMRADFHALRRDGQGEPAPADTPHLVIYANHPSWWDGALYNVLHGQFFAKRAGFAPIDADMLAQYRFMARIGAIGVDQSSRAGAAAFLATCTHVLEDPDRVLWIAAQGRFADVRQRPLALQPGLAHLAINAPQARFVPLAVDYAFWDERTPEAFIRFGPTIAGEDIARLGVKASLAKLEDALTETLDALSQTVMTRDPDRFETLLTGRVGIGGVYDLWRRAKAAWRGEQFDAAHSRPHADADAPS